MGWITPLLPAEDLELRVSPRLHLLAVDWQRRPRRLLLLVGVGVVLVAYSVARDRSLGSWAVAIGFCVVVFAAPSIGARLCARLAVRRGVVEYRGLLGPTRRAKVGDITRGVRVRVEVIGPRFPFTRLLLLDANNHALVSIHEEWWKAADLVRFHQFLGLKVDGAAPSLTPRRANQLYPGASSFALRHRFAVLFSALALGLVALAEILRFVHPKGG